MTSPHDNAQSSTEDWSTYRKLVIDTLRRLDARTLEFHDSLSDIKTRIALIERGDPTDDIDRIDTLIDSLRDDLNKFKTEIVTKQAADNGSRRAFLFIGAGLLTLLNLIVTAFINGFAEKTLGM